MDEGECPALCAFGSYLLAVSSACHGRTSVSIVAASSALPEGRLSPMKWSDAWRTASGNPYPTDTVTPIDRFKAATTQVLSSNMNSRLAERTYLLGTSSGGSRLSIGFGVVWGYTRSIVPAIFCKVVFNSINVLHYVIPAMNGMRAKRCIRWGHTQYLRQRPPGTHFIHYCLLIRITSIKNTEPRTSICFADTQMHCVGSNFPNA
eukprot:1141260-Amphidinium_carterae.1